MFSVSKKSFLLPIILFTTLHIQCCDHNVPNTKHICIDIKDTSEQETSSTWKLVTLFGPPIITWALTQAIQKYYADPEEAAINKELKTIELETKKHPDYPAISLQLKKNKAEEKNLINREKQLELEIKNAQLMQHYEDKLDYFRKCDNPLTQDFCNNMTRIYQEKLEIFTQQRS
jgi:hypothetical protein